jgi:Cd2+/Zn2+-exporting ATPase
MPEDKVTRVRALDEKYGRVAMVGDGVNDAPAMANATVGIAIGGAAGSASDVALETADIALLADDLGKLPEAIGVSRFARKIIVQNLVIALGVIAVLAPLAALGGTPISAAVLFHEGSTVLVVVNSLRILAYRPASADDEQTAS